MRKLVLADEKGTWCKRTLHLQRASVNTDGGGWSRRSRGRGTRAVATQRTAAKQLSLQQIHILPACQQATWRLQLIPLKGFTQRGGGLLRKGPRCKRKSIKSGEKRRWRRKNSCRGRPKSAGGGLSCCRPPPDSPDLCVSQRFTYLSCLGRERVPFLSCRTLFLLLPRHQMKHNVNWKVKIMIFIQSIHLVVRWIKEQSTV